MVVVDLAATARCGVGESAHSTSRPTLEPPPVRRIAVVIDGLDSSTVGAGIRGALEILDLVVPESIALAQWGAAGAIIVGSRSR